MHLFHNWSKWSDPIKVYSGNKQQWRVCKTCNKASFKTLPWDNLPDIDNILGAIREVQIEQVEQCPKTTHTWTSTNYQVQGEENE